MKCLSLVTALVVLVTLFTLVLSQLNKDETKHEYGIAFPLEESESRLPSIGSMLQSESASKAKAGANPVNEATTTTETIATSTANPQDGSVEAATQNESGQDDSDGSTPTNPKLIFIERLMGLNIQRNPGAGNSLLDQDADTGKKAESGSDESSKTADVPWGNPMENIRSKWESRIRKFTYPFQNTYSVVLRASNVVDPAGVSPNGDGEVVDSGEKVAIPLKGAESSSDSSSDANPLSNVKYYMQTASPLQPAGGAQSNQQANQLLRMAALSMMSKLFSAIRSQATYSNSKLDSAGSKLADSDNAEMDIEDEDEESEGDDRNTETISVPIMIGHKPVAKPSAFEGNGYAYSDEVPARGSSMYGRPSAAVHQMMPPAAAHFYHQPAPVSPMASILAALAGAPRNPNYRRLENPAQAETQPQRVILLITHRPGGEEASRDDPAAYQPSAPAQQPSMAYYSPLAPPSSPVYYHMAGQSPPVAAAASSRAQQVVEVPVPVYVPMLRMRPNLARPPPPAMSRLMVPDQRPTVASPNGHVAVVYYPSPEHVAAESRTAESSLYAPSVVDPTADGAEPPAPGMVRILLRPKAESVSPVSRYAYHRRIDDFEEDSSPAAVAAAPSHGFYDGRLRQWRDYHQSVPHHSPMTHLFVASTGRDDQEASASDDHYQHHPYGGSPYYYADYEHAHKHQQSAYMSQHHQPSTAAVPISQGAVTGHAAFLIVADPHASHDTIEA